MLCLLASVAVIFTCLQNMWVYRNRGNTFLKRSSSLWFLLFLIIFTPIICFKETVFWKAIIGGVLILYNIDYSRTEINICHCLPINFSRFGNVGLYVTDNGMFKFFWDCGLFNKRRLFRWSAVSIWVLIIFFVYRLSTNFPISARKCFPYSWNVEQIRFIRRAWLKGMLF